MCVCVYICVYIHIHLYICTASIHSTHIVYRYIHTYTYIHTYIHTHIYTTGGLISGPNSMQHAQRRHVFQGLIGEEVEFWQRAKILKVHTHTIRHMNMNSDELDELEGSLNIHIHTNDGISSSDSSKPIAILNYNFC